MCVVIPLYSIRSLRFVSGYTEPIRELVALDSEEIPVKSLLSSVIEMMTYCYILYKISGSMKELVFFFVCVW